MSSGASIGLAAGGVCAPAQADITPNPIDDSSALRERFIADSGVALHVRLVRCTKRSAMSSALVH
jgi:hypothetical protein